MAKLLDYWQMSHYHSHHFLDRLIHRPYITPALYTQALYYTSPILHRPYITPALYYTGPILHWPYNTPALYYTCLLLPTFNLTTNHGQNYRYFRPCFNRYRFPLTGHQASSQNQKLWKIMDKYTGFPSTQFLQWRRRHKTQDPGHEAWDYSEWIFSNIGPSLSRALSREPLSIMPGNVSEL